MKSNPRKYFSLIQPQLYIFLLRQIYFVAFFLSLTNLSFKIFASLGLGAKYPENHEERVEKFASHAEQEISVNRNEYSEVW